MVASPCTNVCQPHRSTGWCIGCGRSVVEIERWLHASDIEKRIILEKLPARLAVMQGHPAP